MNELNWRDRLETTAAALVGALAVIAAILLSLNTPISFEQVQGTVVRLGSTNSQYALGTRAFIELPDGRVVTVDYPTDAKVPEPGTNTIIIRGKRRFYGESFSR